MKWLVFLLLIFSGCYYLGQNSYRDVTTHPSNEWSDPECLTVIIGAANHNLSDIRTGIRVIATPYYPSVVKAIGRRAQMQYHWSERESRSYVDRLLHSSCGMYVNWDHPGEVVYARGLHRLDSATQFDSLMFLITFQIHGWVNKELRIQVPASGEEGSIEHLIPLDTQPQTEVERIEVQDGTILLVNEKGETISPIKLWGKRMSYLTTNQESMFAMFDLREKDRHFLQESNSFYLTLTGYEKDIRLKYLTDMMK